MITRQHFDSATFAKNMVENRINKIGNHIANASCALTGEHPTDWALQNYRITSGESIVRASFEMSKDRLDRTLKEVWADGEGCFVQKQYQVENATYMQLDFPVEYLFSDDWHDDAERIAILMAHDVAQCQARRLNAAFSLATKNRDDTEAKLIAAQDALTSMREKYETAFPDEMVDSEFDDGEDTDGVLPAGGLDQAADAADAQDALWTKVARGAQIGLLALIFISGGIAIHNLSKRGLAEESFDVSCSEAGGESFSGLKAPSEKSCRIDGIEIDRIDLSDHL